MGHALAGELRLIGAMVAGFRRKAPLIIEVVHLLHPGHAHLRMLPEAMVQGRGARLLRTDDEEGDLGRVHSSMGRSCSLQLSRHQAVVRGR
jgi:hypothetical protein